MGLRCRRGDSDRRLVWRKMTFIRFLVGFLLLAAPMTPGFWRISLAERSEQHDDVVAHGLRVDARGLVEQVPPPLPAKVARALRSRRRYAELRMVRRPVARRFGRPTRLVRRIHYADGDDDPDSAHPHV